ncbi:hypothetical protein L6261_00730 [Candidatus Parcubacteria bacterium]|nr:hypothetical protein [Candidatus Parcubacteria bacterium]
MKKIKSYITLNNAKYLYSLEKRKDGVIFVECPEAKISQEFLAEDVPNLLIDLPNLIMAEKEYKKKQSEIIRFRISQQDKKKIEQKAIKKGFTSVSGYLRDLALN